MEQGSSSYITWTIDDCSIHFNKSVPHSSNVTCHLRNREIFGRSRLNARANVYTNTSIRMQCYSKKDHRLDNDSSDRMLFFGVSRDSKYVIRTMNSLLIASAKFVRVFVFEFGIISEYLLFHFQLPYHDGDTVAFLSTSTNSEVFAFFQIREPELVNVKLESDNVHFRGTICVPRFRLVLHVKLLAHISVLLNTEGGRINRKLMFVHEEGVVFHGGYQFVFVTVRANRMTTITAEARTRKVWKVNKICESSYAFPDIPVCTTYHQRENDESLSFTHSCLSEEASEWETGFVYRATPVQAEDQDAEDGGEFVCYVARQIVNIESCVMSALEKYYEKLPSDAISYIGIYDYEAELLRVGKGVADICVVVIAEVEVTSNDSILSKMTKFQLFSIQLQWHISGGFGSIRRMESLSTLSLLQVRDKHTWCPILPSSTMSCADTVFHRRLHLSHSKKVKLHTDVNLPGLQFVTTGYDDPIS